MAERILIVNFDFPPNEGIGGRRWAKFAKQLAMDGAWVHVIKAAPWSGNKTSPWWPDVRGERIQIHTLPRPIPQFFTHPTGGIVQKILYRVYRQYLSIIDGGSNFDQSIGWNRKLKQQIRHLLQTQGIIKIYATGAPWNMLKAVAEMKDEFPHIKLLVDYRDPWITAMNYGMKGLSAKRMQHEKNDQLFVVQRADAITAPNDHLVKEIFESDDRMAGAWSKFHTLPHVIDPDDLSENAAEENGSNDNSIRIIYGGALYLGTEEYLRRLVDACHSLLIRDPVMASRIRFEFYCPTSPQRKILESCSMIQVSEPIGKELFGRMRKGSYAMILLAGHNKDFRTTKYYECLALEKPLFYLGDMGEVSDEITQRHIGILFENEDSLRDLTKTEQSFDYDYMKKQASKHLLSEVTQRLKDILR